MYAEIVSCQWKSLGYADAYVVQGHFVHRKNSDADVVKMRNI